MAELGSRRSWSTRPAQRQCWSGHGGQRSVANAKIPDGATSVGSAGPTNRQGGGWKITNRATRSTGLSTNADLSTEKTESLKG